MKLSGRKFVLLHGMHNHLEFGKDTFLIPYYFNKIYGARVSIVYVDKGQNLPKTERGIRLISIKDYVLKFYKHKVTYNYDQHLAYLFYVVCNARKIDFLMRFHLTPISMLLGVVYKILNPRGFLYVKADGGGGFTVNNFKRNLKGALKKWVYCHFVSKVDLISVENTSVYQEFVKANMFGVDLRVKTRLLYNGFDEMACKDMDMAIRDFPQKDNLIITVGRLGDVLKNTEMLLAAAQKLELNNWKIVCIGPLEDSFKTTIADFYINNPQHRDRVVFTGAIYDKRVLYDWYNRAKVFVLTSKSESWGLVLNEACRFRNYLISTDVGGARTIIGLTGYGSIIPHEDAAYLARRLQAIMHNDDCLAKEYARVPWDNIDMSWEKLLKQTFSDLIEV